MHIGEKFIFTFKGLETQTLYSIPNTLSSIYYFNLNIFLLSIFRVDLSRVDRAVLKYPNIGLPFKLIFSLEHIMRAVSLLADFHCGEEACALFQTWFITFPSFIFF